MNPTTTTGSDKRLANVALSSTGTLAIGAFLLASFAPATVAASGGFRSGGDDLLLRAGEFAAECSATEIEDDNTEGIETEDGGIEGITNQINWIMTDASARDEDEDAPTRHVADSLIGILRGVDEILGEQLVIPGDVSSFYGELSVTWRNGFRIVSVISTQDGLRIHSGTMADSQPGDYEYHALGNAKDLSTKLQWLTQIQGNVAATLQ